MSDCLDIVQNQHMPPLTLAERQRILVDWNATQTAHPLNTCVHQLFEAQAERTPEAIALAFEGEQLTYRVLNQRSNQLAYHLQQLGVGPEVLVGISAERSIELVVGLLGILKAGGAYVPLDPNHPKERLAVMLADAQVPVLLTQTKVQAALPAYAGTIINLDAGSQATSQDNTENLDSGVRPENLAYVIYTSGSTGTPKGVMVTHRNVTRLFAATDDWYHFHERDVWTLFHSYAFDFSVWELWGALLYGGRVVVVPYLVSRSPEEFYQLLVSEHVTVLNQTPSAFYQLIDAEHAGRVKGNLSLRLVIFGGEALDIPRLKPWFDRHGDQQPQLVNMYGITETTVHVTYRPLTAADANAGSGSVIGYPIPDLHIYVLDQHLQPLPLGVPGELYVGGDGVARGYLNRSELTNQRFIPDPFHPQPGARLYKTGDLARTLSDGDLEYLGRIDQQVKIRGFRVELGEIESVLRQHPSIHEAVVALREDAPGDKRLVAYLVPVARERFAAGALREILAAQLPDYMLPAVFVLLEALPLTLNGKLDRQGLPTPGKGTILRDEGYEPPRTPAEVYLAALWAEMLGVGPIGVSDNFFELGGHSLLATRVLARVQERFHVELPLSTLFEAPTVAGLALTILQYQATKIDEATLAQILAQVERQSLEAEPLIASGTWKRG